MDERSGVAAARYSGEALSALRRGNRSRGTGKMPLIRRFGGYRGCNGCGTSMNLGDSGPILCAGDETENARTAAVTAQHFVHDGSCALITLLCIRGGIFCSR